MKDNIYKRIEGPPAILEGASDVLSKGGDGVC